MLRCGLAGGGFGRLSALDLLPFLDDSDQLQVLDQLVELCMRIPFAVRARQLIVSLPRDRVLSQVANITERFVQHLDHIEFRLLIELFRSLDDELAAALARRAAASSDGDVREVGEDFLRGDTLATDQNWVAPGEPAAKQSVMPIKRFPKSNSRSSITARFRTNEP
jgi:hypothetical protein